MTDLPIISGIQQIGIGNPSVYEAFKWYRQTFGADVPVFDEAAEAALMLPYTGGEPRQRHAILALNMQGGGGLEIWQYTSRTPEPSAQPLLIGDLGINIAKFKSHNVAKAFKDFQNRNISIIGDLTKRPDGSEHFFVLDPYGNICEVVPATDWFNKSNKIWTGGAYGCVIGVSDIEKARTLYSDVLGYDQVIYDETGNFSDLEILKGGDHSFRRVLMTHSEDRQGAFSKLLGRSEIELIQVTNREPVKVFADRFWGDIGFIHLCFDVNGMTELEELCTSKGFPFTVNSGDFDMGEAAGHFAYIEDPDGTLIEFVETHKVPILKKLNWYFNLKNRDPRKPLPSWMIKSMGFGRVKE